MRAVPCPESHGILHVFLAQSGCFCLYGPVHLFIADIHLRPEDIHETQHFTAWIHTHAANAEGIYILGDLFDYWYTGLERRYSPLWEALSDRRIRILPGNRDFLLKNAPQGDVHIEREEEILVTIGRKRVLLCHGHTITRADTRFRFLRACGWPLLERMDALLPDTVKERLARALVRSSAAVRSTLLDIPEDTASKKGADVVICGHLHRHVDREHLIVVPPYCVSGSWLEWREGRDRPHLVCARS